MERKSLLSGIDNMSEFLIDLMFVPGHTKNEINTKSKGTNDEKVHAFCCTYFQD